MANAGFRLFVEFVVRVIDFQAHATLTAHRDEFLRKPISACVGPHCTSLFLVT